MSNWKRLGNIAKGMLREVITEADGQPLSDDELMAKLENINKTRINEASAPKKTGPAPAPSIETNDSPSELNEPTSTPPVTRKPL
jgi:hypothetical protein